MSDPKSEMVPAAATAAGVPPTTAPPTPPATGSAAAASPGSLAPIAFEAAIKRLTEIVQSLERGELPLEESLRLFEEGIKLSRASQQRLDAAEKRVEQLLAVDGDGKARTAPFATDSNREEESADYRPIAPR